MNSNRSIAMNPAVLLAELQVMLNSAPNFENCSTLNAGHLQWLGRTQALVKRWNPTEAIRFQTATEMLGSELMRDSCITKLMLVLHGAIADLTLQCPSLPDQAFGPGAVYDFFKALRDLLGTASSSAMIVDPYLDADAIDAYLPSIAKRVQTKLLTRGSKEDLVQATRRYTAQHGQSVELRRSSELHDRVIIIDDTSCWVIGQSLKDAAKSKPTYIAPLSIDTAADKIRAYARIWDVAEPI